jgi:hypothetical protein
MPRPLNPAVASPIGNSNLDQAQQIDAMGSRKFSGRFGPNPCPDSVKS